jgi:hypothetical protein
MGPGLAPVVPASGHDQGVRQLVLQVEGRRHPLGVSLYVPRVLPERLPCSREFRTLERRTARASHQHELASHTGIALLGCGIKREPPYPHEGPAVTRTCPLQ